MKIGDTVKVITIPGDLPPDKALQTLFRGALNKTFKIAGFDDDLLELHVGEAFGEPADKHRIWIGPDHVRLLQAS